MCSYPRTAQHRATFRRFSTSSSSPIVLPFRRRPLPLERRCISSGVSSLPEKQSPRDRASIVEISSTTRRQRSRSNGERNDTGSRDREAIGSTSWRTSRLLPTCNSIKKKKNEADLRPASRTTFAMTTLVDDARYDTMIVDVSCDEDETKVVGTTDGTMVSN